MVVFYFLVSFLPLLHLVTKSSLFPAMDNPLVALLGTALASSQGHCNHSSVLWSSLLFTPVYTSVYTLAVGAFMVSLSPLYSSSQDSLLAWCPWVMSTCGDTPLYDPALVPFWLFLPHCLGNMTPASLVHKHPYQPKLGMCPQGQS